MTNATAGAPVRTNPLAVVALVAAFVLPLAGIVVGHVALHQLRRSGEAGIGLARAGTILGYLFTLTGAVALAVYLNQVLAQIGM
jgi:hypothetical protein